MHEEPETEAALTLAADEVIRQAVATNDVEVISRALEQHRTNASEAVVAEARTARGKAKEKRRKESQKQRRAHGAMMMTEKLKAQEMEAEAQRAMESLSLNAGTAAAASRCFFAVSSHRLYCDLRLRH